MEHLFMWQGNSLNSYTIPQSVVYLHRNNDIIMKHSNVLYVLQFHMTGEMQLKASYFNEKLSVWEPLIEPVSEKEGVYRPYETVIKVRKFSFLT